MQWTINQKIKIACNYITKVKLPFVHYKINLKYNCLMPVEAKRQS